MGHDIEPLSARQKLDGIVSAELRAKPDLLELQGQIFQKSIEQGDSSFLEFPLVFAQFGVQ
mgnify:CR=1 FL=1